MWGAVSAAPPAAEAPTIAVAICSLHGSTSALAPPSTAGCWIGTDTRRCLLSSSSVESMRRWAVGWKAPCGRWLPLTTPALLIAMPGCAAGLATALYERVTCTKNTRDSL